eukprot:UN02195
MAGTTTKFVVCFLALVCFILCIASASPNGAPVDTLKRAADQLVGKHPELFKREELFKKLKDLSHQYLDAEFDAPVSTPPTNPQPSHRVKPDDVDSASPSTREWVAKKINNYVNVVYNLISLSLSQLKFHHVMHQRVTLHQKFNKIPHHFPTDHHMLNKPHQFSNMRTKLNEMANNVLSQKPFAETDVELEEAVLTYKTSQLKPGVTSQAYCANVFAAEYKVYPQRINIDTENVSISFQDLECERHIERDTFVSIIPIVAGLLSDDELRYDWVKLTCSWFYRPLFNPTMLPCLSQCQVLRDYVTGLDVSTATPAQLRDKAVLETFAMPQLLLGGQCEYTDFYDHSDDKTKCIHGDDTSILQTN